MAGVATEGRHRVRRCGAGQMRLVAFVYDGCAESWIVEGTDSDVFATVRGRRRKVTNICGRGWWSLLQLGGTGRVIVQTRRTPCSQGASGLVRTRCKCTGVDWCAKTGEVRPIDGSGLEMGIDGCAKKGGVSESP